MQVKPRTMNWHSTWMLFMLLTILGSLGSAIYFNQQDGFLITLTTMISVLAYSKFFMAQLFSQGYGVKKIWAGVLTIGNEVIGPTWFMFYYAFVVFLAYMIGFGTIVEGGGFQLETVQGFQYLGSSIMLAMFCSLGYWFVEGRYAFYFESEFVIIVKALLDNNIPLKDADPQHGVIREALRESRDRYIIPPDAEYLVERAGVTIAEAEQEVARWNFLRRTAMCHRRLLRQKGE